MGRSNRYPRVMRDQRGKRGKRHQCSRCGEPTRQRVSIQWGWFRGDDDVLPLCGPCQEAMDDDAVLAHNSARLLARNEAAHG